VAGVGLGFFERRSPTSRSQLRWPSSGQVSAGLSARLRLRARTGDSETQPLSRRAFESLWARGNAVYGVSRRDEAFAPHRAHPAPCAATVRCSSLRRNPGPCAVTVRPGVWACCIITRPP